MIGFNALMIYLIHQSIQHNPPENYNTHLENTQLKPSLLNTLDILYFVIFLWRGLHCFFDQSF